MNITEFCICVLLVSFLASFILVLLTKWGVIEWLQVHGRFDLVISLANCGFCLSWWSCVIVAAILVLISGNIWLLAVPVFSTNITRALL